jgi:hypothetical protein
LTNPFASMILKFVREPLVTAAEHHQRAFSEGADIGLEIPEDVFPTRR